MNTYDYAPKCRPAGFGTVPAGWDMVERSKSGSPRLRRDLPMGDRPFGVIRYRRPLSRQEIESYELEPV